MAFPGPFEPVDPDAVACELHDASAWLKPPAVEHDALTLCAWKTRTTKMMAQRSEATRRTFLTKTLRARNMWCQNKSAYSRSRFDNHRPAACYEIACSRRESKPRLRLGKAPFLNRLDYRGGKAG